MNFFPFHPGDYMLRTAHLDPIEDLAYRRLIDLYYVNEAPLSGTPEELSRVIRLRAHSAEVEAVLREFFAEENGTWNHSHCDDVIDQYRAKAQQAVENGKRGGRPKKNQNEPSPNPEETQPVISDNPAETGSKANQEPITNNQNQEDQKNTLPARDEPVDPVTAVNPKLPVEMELTWQPDQKILKTYALHAGLALDLFTSEVLAAFTLHHEPSGVMNTQAKWVAMLVRWVQGDKAKASNVRPFPKAATSRHHGFAERDYTDGLIKREDGTYAF